MEVKNRSELIYLNAFNRISFLGSRRIKVLIDFFGNAEVAWAAPFTEIAVALNLKNGIEQLRKEKEALDPEKEWQLLEDNRIKSTAPSVDGYPELLKEINHIPPILYYRGRLETLNRPAIAIVGSRRCTFYGQEVAYKLASELASAGVAIVSGMALGIDTAAHRGALECAGYTAAVLGCSLDRCYPPGNQELMDQISSCGVILSEFALGTEPLPFNFPQRNRIISGLSHGTVVVEATAKSGSLITANYALEQNREVFAVPGNIGSPYSRGCHRLIKDGAKLVESAADIFDELALDRGLEEQQSFSFTEQNLNGPESKLLQVIPYQQLHIDDIIRLSGLRAAEASALLLSLELKKQIRQAPGKYFCRI
jgi:DNA processing protein